MSNFSSMYTSLRTLIPTLLTPTPSELANPYSLDLCSEPTRRNGWGITIGQASANQDEFNSFVDNHSISIVLVRELLKKENDPGPLVSVTESLKNDVATLQSKLETGLRFNLPAVEQFTYVNSTPITRGSNERQQWLTITITFSASVRELLT